MLNRPMLLRFLAVAYICAFPALLPARTVVMVPHPDDESIGIAGTIRELVLSGEEVWIVLATHGESSGYFPVLNGDSFCSRHSRTHNPVAEGYAPSDLTNGKLTRTTFGIARVREFHASLEVLGVQYGRRRVYNRAPLNDAAATQLVSEIVQEFGTDTNYITVQGETDTVHTEHHALARALANHVALPPSKKAYYGVYEFADTTHPNTAGGSNPKYIGAFQPAKYNALQQYKLWQPSIGRYMIGYHSTANLIDNAAASDYEYPLVTNSAVAAWELY